jgi:PilZ domain-containing protein
MKPDSGKRVEIRFVIEAGALVQVTKNNLTFQATTVNMSGSGVLMRFAEPVQLVVGDRLDCEFKIVHDADKPLPYWSVGNVVRVEDCLVAVEFKGVGFTPLKPESRVAHGTAI